MFGNNKNVVLALLLAVACSNARTQAQPSAARRTAYAALVWGSVFVLRSTLPESWQAKLSLKQLNTASKVTMRTGVAVGAATLGLSTAAFLFYLGRQLSKLKASDLKEMHDNWLGVANRYASIVEDPEKQKTLLEAAANLPQEVQVPLLELITSVSDWIKKNRLA